MSELDMMGSLAAVIPQGPDAASDPALVTTGPVYGIDAAARLVQVGVHDAALWLPAMPGRYRTRASTLSTAADTRTAGLARVLMNPTTGRPALVLGPVDPRSPHQAADLTAINTTTKRATVSLDGGSYVLPYLASTYTVGTPVWVGLDDWGVPDIVIGPSDVTAAPAPVTPPPPAASTVQVVDQPIGAQWSGTYRHNRSAWDRWNTTSYGGRSTLYQGDGFGSGPLTGLATYGDQLVNLGAISIDRLRVVARGVGLSGASGPATVQGSPDGAQPGGGPTGIGDLATGDGLIELSPATRESFRTGAMKGLVLVGANYWAVAGAGNGDGMTLLATYTRPA